MRDMARRVEKDRAELFRATAQAMPPPPHHLDELQQDYRAMRGMLFGTVPEFDEIIGGLAVLKKSINEPKAVNDETAFRAEPGLPTRCYRVGLRYGTASPPA